MQGVPIEAVIAVLTLFGAGITFMFSKQTVEAIITLGTWWRDGREKRMRLLAELKKGDAELRKQEEDRKTDVMALDEELNDRGHKWIIRKQDRRITELENRFTQLSTEHSNCREEYAVLQTKYREAMDRIESLERKLSSIPNLKLMAIGSDPELAQAATRILRHNENVKRRQQQQEQRDDPRDDQDSGEIK